MKGKHHVITRGLSYHNNKIAIECHNVATIAVMVQPTDGVYDNSERKLEDERRGRRIDIRQEQNKDKIQKI